MPVCCVVNCKNKPGRDIEFKYYCFPWKSYETERRDRWIHAVRRIMPDGKPWMPIRRRTLICSAHFVGGKKSDEMHSPSYVPTIFPDVYKSKSPSKSSLARYDRLKTRRMLQQHQDWKQLIGSTSAVEVSDPTLRTPKNKNEMLGAVEVYLENERMYKPNQITTSTQTDITINPKLDNTQHLTQQNNTEDNISDISFNENEHTQQICRGFHGFESIKSRQQMMDVTGVSIFIFTHLLSLLPKCKKNDKFSNKDKLLIFLMAMKLGLTFSALSVLFGCVRSSISRTFQNVLDVLYVHRMGYIFWPDKFTVLATLPNSFKNNYRNCRIILNCSEFRVQQPKTIEKRVHLFSNYKQTFTIKVLIGITPSGFISLVSDCCGGRISDTQITLNSELLAKLEPGDMVIANKGFVGIKAALDEQHVTTVMPPYCQDKANLTDDELEETCSNDSVRLHVERAVERIKKYNILKDIPVSLFSDIDKIVQVAAMLCNLGKPLITKDSFK